MQHARIKHAKKKEEMDTDGRRQPRIKELERVGVVGMGLGITPSNLTAEP